jgi:hypothetical protein
MNVNFRLIKAAAVCTVIFAAAAFSGCGREVKPSPEPVNSPGGTAAVSPGTSPSASPGASSDALGQTPSPSESAGNGETQTAAPDPSGRPGGSVTVDTSEGYMEEDGGSPPPQTAAPAAATPVPRENKLSDIEKKVKDAIGSQYLPTDVQTASQIAERLVVPPVLYEAALVVAPPYDPSIAPDIFAGFLAKDGESADNIEKALTSYRETLVSEAGDLQMNSPRIKASTVYRKGDYVFFLLIDDKLPDPNINDEQRRVDVSKQTMKKVTDAVDAALK